MKTLLIITGWTRGLGEGIVKGYAKNLGKELAVIAIARSTNAPLEDSLAPKVARFASLSANLSQYEGIESAIQNIDLHFNSIAKSLGEPEQYILVNNAAILEPIGLLHCVAEREAFFEHSSAAFTLNCIAPAMLSGFFASKLMSKVGTAHKGLILNISSGASQGPMPGAGLYSMTKSALNMLSTSLVQDWAEGNGQTGQKMGGTRSGANTHTGASADTQHRNGLQVISLSPGMVETRMQEHLRSQSTANFPNVEYFREAFDSGTIGNHLEVGELIASYNYDTLENGSYHHIRELMA